MLSYVTATILKMFAQQPPSIWNDPNTLIGIGVGLLGAIATIGAAIYTVRQGRIKRSIEYQVISSTPIATLDSTVAGKIEVLFKGQPAENARILVIKVRNAGNSSIRKEDYFEPLTFEFNTEVLSANVLETEPPTLLSPQMRKNFLMLGTHNVQFPSFPLNPRNALTMTIFLKEKSVVHVRGRLDQGKINKAYPREVDKDATILFSFSFIFGISGVLLSYIFENVIGTTIGFLISLTAIILLSIGAILAFITGQRAGRRHQNKVETEDRSSIRN